jgi:hypothetical protein
VSWAYAKHRFAYTWTLDPSEWNDNIVPFASEMNGNLNEQNWSSSGTPIGTMMSNGLTEFDIIARVFGEKNRVDPLGATSAMFKVPMSTKWTPITTSEKAFGSRGGLALIIISFQMHCPSVPAEMSGLIFAIEVDGEVRADSLLGTGDQGNDLLDTAFGATVGGGEVDYDFGTSPSFRSEQEPKMVKLLIRVEPGQHVGEAARVQSDAGDRPRPPW